MAVNSGLLVLDSWRRRLSLCERCIADLVLLVRGAENSQQIQEGFNVIDRDVLGKDLRIEGDFVY